VVGRVHGVVAIAAVFAIALLTVGAAGAGANTVVNGGFETGDFEGWELINEPQPPTGSWIVYGGGGGPTPPPQGEFAALTEQEDPGTHILYQDVPIEAGQPYLSMTVFYDSNWPITVPTPDTLEAAGGVDENQQYRIEVMNPAAPLESVEPSDILATVFRTLDGDPASIDQRKVGVDLSAFVGQTVRLRLAEADNRGFFNAGVDSVMTGPVPSPAPLVPPITPIAVSPSNFFTVGKLKLNKKNGTATLKVTLPGPGTLTATDAKAKSPKRIKKATVVAAAAGTVTLNLKPTGAGKKTLTDKGSLKFKATLAFTPPGGSTGTQVLIRNLKMNLAP
jgi:hypothetical protein